MIETLYHILFSFCLIYLALLTFFYLMRAIIGPGFFDRILGINNISTLVILIISILSVVQQESYIVDVALIYAMLGFVTIVIVCKAYLRSHHKQKDHDFENLKQGSEDDD